MQVACQHHRAPGHVDLVNRLCTSLADGAACTRRALFGDPARDVTGGKRRPRFCGRHRGPGDVDLMNRRCRAAGCAKHPSFGEPGSGRAVFCMLHKGPSHVNCIAAAAAAGHAAPDIRPLAAKPAAVAAAAAAAAAT